MKITRYLALAAAVLLAIGCEPAHPRVGIVNYGSGALSSVTATAPLTGAGTSASPLALAAASGSTNGYLSSTDWTSFNTHLSARVFVTATPEVDLLTISTLYTLVPQASPVGSLSGKRVQVSTRYMCITQLTGTITGAPQWKAGNDGSNVNLQTAVASGTGTTTAAVSQCASAGGGTFPVPAVDMTAGDIKLVITQAATGTGLTVAKAKFYMVTMVMDL